MFRPLGNLGLNFAEYDTYVDRPSPPPPLKTSSDNIHIYHTKLVAVIRICALYVSKSYYVTHKSDIDGCNISHTSE